MNDSVDAGTGLGLAAATPEAELLSSLLDEVDEALSWFDEAGVLRWSNPAAVRASGIEPGHGAAAATGRLGGAAAQWLQAALKASGRVETTLRSPGGARWRSIVWALGRGRAWRLHELPPRTAAAPRPAQSADAAWGPAPAPATTTPTTPVPADSVSPLLAAVWAGPLPAAVQDADFRLVDVNDAYCAAVGWPREALLGRDPLDWQPPEDHEMARLARVEARSAAAPGPTLRRRMHDAQGQQRWFAVTSLPLDGLGPGTAAAAGPMAGAGPAHSPRRWLSLWQDTTGEVAARDHARRVQDELAQWFGLSGTGMLVYDDTGLIVRSNAAFEALVEHVPEVLGEATPELQTLLAWAGDTPHASLQPGAAAVERQVLLPLADGRRRRLVARLSCYAADRGERRVMAVVEDRSAEDERDLAQLERGMLMDTGSIGVATYDPARGWLAPGASPGASDIGRAADTAPPVDGSGARRGGALLGIGRELVETESLPEYERLQRALRAGERAEVRYAVRHPELGLRWLLTRVEPAALAGGRSTTSVVTLDVTEQEKARRRNEALLRELTTILDGSTAGIAYLRGPLLLRCNHRFERMLGLPPGGAAGASLDEILGRLPDGARIAQQAAEALAEGRRFEAELAVRPARISESGSAVSGAGTPPPADGKPAWLSLSVRRAEPGGALPEAVAVLTDVSRLKTQQDELEQLLRERELMFSLSDVGIAYLRGARVERANNSLAALTGYSLPELMTLDTAELYASARDCVDFEARVVLGLRAHGRFSGERRLRRRDGAMLWVQVAVRPVDPDDTDAGVICSFVDVDERHRARTTLAAQAERTKAVLDSVLVGIVTVSSRGIEWMNRSARRMFGGELADFVGEPISIVATPEPGHPLRRSDWTERLRDGQSETFECRLQGRDGRTFWVVGNAVVTRGEAGAGAPLTFALLDIERRRQAEMRIAQAQASLQRVIETAPLAIALFDASSLRVLQLNHTAASFFGRPLEAVLGLPLAQACDPGRAEVLRGWLQAAAGASEAQQHEWRDGADVHGAGDAASDGGRVWDCRIVALAERATEAAPGTAATAATAATAGAAGPAGTAIVDADGDAPPSQLLLVASDVTEQRAAERARLQGAIAQREVLVREVHHRIKNNLQGVAGLLRQNAARHPELSGPLTEAVGQVQAIAQVYGLQVGASGPLAVASVLRAIAQSVQRTFGRRIEVAAGEATTDAMAADAPSQPDLWHDGVVHEPLSHLLPEAESIPVALTLNELLTNAIKHGQGGAVQCQAWADGDVVTIRITSEAQLAAGFDLAQIRGGVSGLGLVRALLPRRSATLAITQQGTQVVAEVTLRPPSVRRADAAVAAGAAGSAGAAVAATNG